MSYIGCIKALSRAAGRELSDEEVTSIYERVHKAALDIKAGRATPEDVKLGKKLNTLGLASDQEHLIQGAAERAAAELLYEAKFHEYQANLQLSKLSGRLNDLKNIRATIADPLDAVDRTLFRNYDGKTDVRSYETILTGKRSYLQSKLPDVFEALGDNWLGFFQDKKKTLNLVKEMLGESSGDVEAAKGGKAWTKVSDEAHTMLRQAGGVIGALDEAYVPQGWWDQQMVAKFGRDKFINSLLPVLEKTQAKGKYYVDDFGLPWQKNDLEHFIGKAWDSIATNGHSNVEPGKFKGSGSVANRHSEHRQIHFPDAESVITAWEQFGGKSVPEILYGHLDSMARDISLLEWGGPNPQTTYRTMRDSALRDAINADPVNVDKLQATAARMDGYYDYISGKTDPIAYPKLHRFVNNVLPLNVASKLGGAVWASVFGDKVMFEAVRHLNDLPAFRTWNTELALLNPLNVMERRLLQRQGLMLDQLRGSLLRFGDDIGNTSTMSKVANVVMEISAMNLANNGRKGALGSMLFDAIGTEIQAGKSFADLHTSDRRILSNYGITESTWKVWQKAELQDLGHGNNRALTPDAIARISDAELEAIGFDKPVAARRDAITNLLGAVNSEVEFGIVTPGLKERAQFHTIGNNKSMLGEIGRTVLQFKSFPWTQFHRMLDAVSNKETPASKAAMTVYIVGATTLAGAMIMQTREMLAGKDPRPMDDWKFWVASFIQGGSLGLYGDFLYSVNSTRYGTGPLETLAGPTVGPLMEMALVQPLNAAKKKIEGKETHLAAQTIADLKSFVPGNNLWYTKSAVDHLLWQNVMDTVSPGYLSNMQEKTLREYGQDWWWTPGELTPDRAPNVRAALGDYQ